MRGSPDNPKANWPVFALWGAVAGVALVTLAAVLWVNVFTVSATVGGKSMRFWAGTTVADLSARRLVSGERGDLVSARAGKVLKAGGGQPSRVLVNDVAAPGEARLRRGDVVVAARGLNTTEPVLVRTEAVPIKTTYRGSGPVETLVTTGSAGVKRVRYGSLSKETVSTKVVKKPVNRVVQLSEPAPGSKMIALTFDDGPWPGQTAAILKILKANNVRATFFQVGELARKHPSISRSLTDAGMDVANHSESHPLNLNHAPSATVGYQIKRAQKDIASASGQTPKYFRPPGGITTPSMFPVLDSLGMKWVQWDIDTNDWKEPSTASIVNTVVKKARPGAVVLMHDGGGNRKHTIQALPIIIKKLKAQGYTFVTLDSLKNLPHSMG
jgi:peptidoglycan-N-acetylglucosamine deacetylase